MKPGALLTELRDETLPQLPRARLALEHARESGKPEHVLPLRELFHKLAGTAAPVGLPHLSQLARFGEELSLLVLNGDAKPTDATLSLLGRMLDGVDAALDFPEPAEPRDAPPHFSPSASAEAPSFPRPRVKVTPAGSVSDSPRVLMVDGDAVSVKLFGRVLTDHGFEVKTVTTAEARGPLEEGFGDVLLLDVSKAGVTPATQDLLALAKTKRLPVVVLSKVPREHESLATLGRGADDFLTKPVAPEQMVSVVRTHAERRRAVRSARSRAATALTPSPSLTGAVVLVVDDSRVIRGLVREFLSELQIEVVEAEDGGEALKALHGMPRLPDAIVVDMQMPILDGLALTQQLRARDDLRRMPIVMLSAQDDAASKQAALAAGANTFLVKEKFDAPELRRALRSAGMDLLEPGVSR